MAGGRDLIASPPRRVQQHTLWGASTRPEQGARWQAGVTWRARPCGDTGGVLVPSCDPYVDPDTQIGEKLPTATFATGEYDPIIVWAAARCTAGTFDDMLGEVRDTLTIDRHRQLEAEFWRGTLAQAEGNDNPYLAKVGTVDVLSTDPVGYRQALADLQQAIAGCGGRGMIHAPVRTVSIWAADGGVRVDGTSLVDAFGNLIVPGVGYDGSGPGGDVDPTGQTGWAYATGLVVSAFGDDLGLSSIERNVNDQQVIVEQIAGAWFDECCLTGINVDLCSTGCSPIGS